MKESPLCGAPRNSLLGANHVVRDSQQLNAQMTATLSAELDGRVPPGLVDEIVRAVLDESRKAVQGPAVELTMLVARQRLERFVRARSAR